MTVRVVPATAQDAGRIACLQIDSWRVAYRDLLPKSYLTRLSIDEKQQQWSSVIARPAVDVIIAIQDGVAAGFAAYGPCRDDDVASDTIELYAIYVGPQWYRQGIGSRLCHRMLGEPPAANASSTCLWVLEDNRLARQFYTTRGFQPDGCIKTVVLGDTHLNEVRYVRGAHGAPL